MGLSTIIILWLGMLSDEMSTIFFFNTDTRWAAAATQTITNILYKKSKQ